MRIWLKYFMVSMAFIAISGCAGTGASNINDINTLIQQTNGNNALVSRNTGFAGSAARINVSMDGTTVATLGNGEVSKFSKNAAGKHVLTLSFEGISQLGVSSNSLSFINDPSRPQYFSVTLKQGIIGATLTISEVTAGSFKNSVK